VGVIGHARSLNQEAWGSSNPIKNKEGGGFALLHRLVLLLSIFRKCHWKLEEEEEDPEEEEETKRRKRRHTSEQRTAACNRRHATRRHTA
jgi:hypothetical protein